MMDRYISVDVETSGPRVALHSMLQIGACTVDDPSETFQGLLVPISEHADPNAMEIVGKPLSYFNENGRDPIAVMHDFGLWVRATSGADRNPVFIGFNAAFDWSFVNWYFLKFGDAANPFGVSPLDIKSYYAGLSGCDWEDTRSSRIPKHLKASTRHTHDALDDAIEQAEMFRRMRDSR
jgi:DNA polymerase III epsilon subunit-like protein